MINAAVLGSPIRHSLSPLLHTYAYKYLGIDALYTSFEVKSGELSQFLAGQGKELTAISLTMPLKEEALRVTSAISDLAKRIESANTLVKVDGLWQGSTTDVEGFKKALEFNQVQEFESIMILGSGATARAVAAACDVATRHIYVVGRSDHRHKAIQTAAPQATISFLPWEVTDLINTVDLVVNTTPTNSAEFLLSGVHSPRGALFDVIYNPWPTRLAAKWVESSRVIDGLELLIHQGISQMQIFSGEIIDRDLMAPLLRRQAIKAMA